MKYQLSDDHILVMEQDMNAEDPNTDQEMYHVYCNSRSFCVGSRDIIEEYNDKGRIFIIGVTIHSGTLLTRNPMCEWDSTQVVLFVHDDILNQDNVTEDEIIQDIIDTWNIYLNGNVYTMTIYKQYPCKCCGHIKLVEEYSIGGFYGDDPTTNGMSDHIDYVILNKIEDV